MNKMKKNMNSNTKWNKFVNNTQAVTPTYEYIILIGILIVYITLFLTIYADEFGIAPLRIAMQTQFEDIGNDISSKVVDMYIIAPESGYLKTKFYMPQAVGKYEYKVEFKEIGLDQQILVSALRFEKEVMITLNKIGSSLGLTGSTYSSTPEHWLIYSMSSQYDLTPIAVAYPREVSYNLTSGWSDIVVFDGSDSKGIGELQYKWDFNGDGIVDATNATEYYQYSAPGVYNATLTIYDPILDREASTTVQVNVTTSYIEPSIDAYKYVSPRSFGVGKPSYTTIVLYGKGIPQNESHIDVMQVIDVSGSMDPDWLKIAGGDPETGYTPFSNKSIKGTAGSKIWTESFSLTSAANETIEKLHVELWNVSGSNNVDLYVKPPGGIAERAQTITPWYERYEKANPPLGSYTIYVLGDFPVGSQSFKVNVNKTSKISISGAVDTYTWSNTTYNLNVAKWMETYITWPTSSVDLNLYLTDPSSATYAPTSANLSSPSRNWERIYLTNIKAGDWTVAVYNNGSYPTYNVTIQAWCIEENKDPKVDITMDGSSTGKKTPHTFTGLTGTHTFTVPSSDSKGHQFWKWNETGSTSRTISVSSSGTYTAVYRQPPPTPTPTPTFTISNPGEQTVYRGSSKSISITVTSYYGYNKEVSLNASGMPSGTTITFTPDKKTPTFSSTMTINVSASTPTGNYPITIIGTGSDGLVKTQTFTLYIPDFSISASPSSGSVKTTGGSTNYTITLTSLYKFAGSISLSISGLPAGASATFSPNPVSLSAGQTKTSTLTVSVPPGTPVGDYTLTITGISGSLSHSTSVTLKVIIPPPGLLYWLARLYEISLPSPWISARAAPGVESFTGYIRLGETPVTNFSGNITASEPPRWDNTESPILINESIENFKISLNYYDEYGNESLHFWVSKNGAPPVLVAGLMGEYYDNMDLTNLKLTRLDPVVDFNWGSGSPHSSIEADTFSVRWTGYVKVDRSETYTFYVVTDDGSRVWVDDTLIIDSWINQSTTERSGSIYLAEGWHKIKYEYYENTGSATARLLYSSPSTPKQVIPQDHLSPVNMKGNVCINYTETNVIAPATYTIYITGTFLSGTKDFELQTYMAKLDAARISGKTFEDMLNSSSDKSGLVSFGGNATIINQSDVRLIQSLTYSHSLVKAGFDLLEAHNGTPVGEAIYVAVQELNNSSEFFTENDRTRVPVIILLSDGLPTLPATLEEISENNYTRAIQYALEQANIAKSMGILIYAIGFGVDADMNFLANISSGEGFYFFAATKEELQAIYLQIVKELREYAGRNVVITDVVPAGINVVSAPGASEIINNDDGTTTIIWRVGGVKIYRHGQTPLVRRLVISTMSTGSTNANVYGLSNVTYTNVITGDLTTFVFPETNIYVKPVGSGQMSME
ncbi:MAG: PA14 domain-containing protein [Methanocellales archaeon]